MFSLQLVGVYKHFFFWHDPNWIPSPYGISSLECIGKLSGVVAPPRWQLSRNM